MFLSEQLLQRLLVTILMGASHLACQETVRTVAITVTCSHFTMVHPKLIDTPGARKRARAITT
ncbi:hypothetical protein CERSUDRAFT_96754 [Gelatoporia subvermispora B]|uniref:Secreted protein n=1 Tax=Ceriporiopsis subvermispora (strain B) TaxID=914234 RepID=M2QU85_CERS8|nr:hypothetical protein CERSUDRAFT_96754 [Gelatoporia subvermispora B]